MALASRHLPLGVLTRKDFDDKTEVHSLSQGDQLFLMSDGVIDTANADDQLFGAERLQAVLSGNRWPHRLFEEIQGALDEFRGESRDDVSMVQIFVVEPSSLPHTPVIFSDSGQSSPLDWSAAFEYCGETLRRFNPLPHLLQLLQEVHGLRTQSGALYSVLTELYSNALEHGVLGLDSELKRDARGFAQYYRQRNERLAALDSGFVRLQLRVTPEGNGGGRLTIRVEDSGNGFDVPQVLARPTPSQGLSGRGVSLVRQLSERAEWAEDGRSVCVEFAWRSPAGG
jgi:hypothetical protein